MSGSDAAAGASGNRTINVRVQLADGVSTAYEGVVVLFRVRAVCSGQPSGLSVKRFTQFVEFDSELRAHFRAHHPHLVSNLPALPPRDWLPKWAMGLINSFKNNAEEAQKEATEARREALQVYLNKLVAVPYASELQLVTDFLGLKPVGVGGSGSTAAGGGHDGDDNNDSSSTETKGKEPA